MTQVEEPPLYQSRQDAWPLYPSIPRQVFVMADRQHSTHSHFHAVMGLGFWFA